MEPDELRYERARELAQDEQYVTEMEQEAERVDAAQTSFEQFHARSQDSAATETADADY